MVCVLRYGIDSAVRLELPSEVLLADCNAPRGEPLADVAAAVGQSLRAPMDFPPLSQAALPGDKVVIALDHGVPRSASLVAGIVNVLLEAGVAAGDVTVLRTRADVEPAGTDPLAELPEAIRGQIRLSTHDPNNRDSLCYLAASTENKPIYMNRDIFDADLVLPVGCLRLPGSLGYHGINSGLFPTFSDVTSFQRYRSPSAADSPVQRKRLCKQADEVSWLLGVLFTIQVVPGAGDEILHVLSGSVKAVVDRGTELYEAAWCYAAPRRASLVVAAIEGEQQTWENVARALAAASQAVEDDGTIAICTDLAEQLGPALQQIAGADDPREVLRQIARERLEDVLPASQLLHTLEHNKVYLLSRLDQAVVEDLGVAPVAGPEQIARLTARHRSCIVLANAQHALVTTAE